MIELSIVIISYNTQRLTRECLESVYANCGELEVEVIVVDNNSADGSQAMIKALYPQVRLIENTSNTGFAAANNQAFAVAQGEYVLLLNSDTLILGDVLTQSVAYMRAHRGGPGKGVGAMGCRVLNGDGSLQFTCSRFPSFLNLALMTTGLDRLPWPNWADRYRMTRWGRRDERDVDVVTGCYLLIDRRVLEEVGGLDESFFFYGEETDWCRRCRDSRWAVRFAPVGEIVHYGSGSSRGLNHRRDLLLSKGLVQVNRKHYGLLAGLAVWLLLGVFNASRCVMYAAGSAFGRGRDVQRATHFARVTAGFRQAWCG